MTGDLWGQGHYGEWSQEWEKVPHPTRKSWFTWCQMKNWSFSPLFAIFLSPGFHRETLCWHKSEQQEQIQSRMAGSDGIAPVWNWCKISIRTFVWAACCLCLYTGSLLFQQFYQIRYVKRQYLRNITGSIHTMKIVVFHWSDLNPYPLRSCLHVFKQNSPSQQF